MVPIFVWRELEKQVKPGVSFLYPGTFLVFATKVALCLPVNWLWRISGWLCQLEGNLICCANAVISAWSGAFIPCVVTAAERPAGLVSLEHALELVWACCCVHVRFLLCVFACLSLPPEWTQAIPMPFWASSFAFSHSLVDSFFCLTYASGVLVLSGPYSTSHWV